MGGLPTKEAQLPPNGAFGPKEMYNLKQVYYFLCLHTTTLTSCQLDHNQFHSLFGAQKQYESLWRTLFNAIDQKHDNVIDFEEFLQFVTHLKRGDIEDKRLLCFRVFDSDRDGYADKGDFRRIAEIRAASQRKAWNVNSDSDAEDECTQFFSLVDEDHDGRFSFEDFDNYCTVYGEAIVNQSLKLFEIMFDVAIEETGIAINATDVKNSKPHIDWQDHKIRMGSYLCCSSSPPIFTKAPTI